MCSRAAQCVIGVAEHCSTWHVVAVVLHVHKFGFTWHGMQLHSVLLLYVLYEKSWFDYDACFDMCRHPCFVPVSAHLAAIQFSLHCTTTVSKKLLEKLLAETITRACSDELNILC
jgi:hypothetical protein